ERRDVSLHALLRLLPEREGACDIPPVERFAALAEKSLRVAEVHPHGPRLAREAIAAIDHLAGLVEVPRIGLERAERQLEPVPSRVVVARLQTTDGLLELRGCRLDARVPFSGAQFLEERVDLASDEVDERHVEGASGVRDERDRSLDVASLARLDGVVDDPFSFFDLEPDPLGRDEERLHLVHQFREFAVEELSVSGWNSAFRFPSGPPQLVDPVLRGLRAGFAVAAGPANERVMGASGRTVSTTGGGPRIFPIGAVTVCASSANRTPQLGQRSASAGTEVLHTGHSYSVDSPSENSAPQLGHTVAFAETSVSQTGQRNCSPRSAAASVTGLGFASAPTSADSGVSR